MKKLFSTADVHQRDRFDYWHNVACENIVGHSSEPLDRHTFTADIQAETVDDLGVLLLQAAPMDVARSTRHIGRAEGDDVLLCHKIAGSLTIEQGGQRVDLRAGNFGVLDPLIPYTAQFSGASNLLVIKIPRHELSVRLGRTTNFVGSCIGRSSSEGRFASNFFTMLPDVVGGLNQTAQKIAKAQTLDLLALALSTAHELPSARASTSRQATLLRLKFYIETMLSSPDLDASTIAAAAGVSVRYANAIFSDQDTSLMQFVQKRRLARCRQALEDPAQDYRSISEIAFGWGFSDMTHFGRSFKAAFGLLPRDFRKRASMDRAGLSRDLILHG